MGTLIATLISNSPGLVALIKGWHTEANPSAPPLTDGEVFAALHEFALSEATKIDAAIADIRKRHPGV